MDWDSSWPYDAGATVRVSPSRVAVWVALKPKHLSPMRQTPQLRSCCGDHTNQDPSYSKEVIYSSIFTEILFVLIAMITRNTHPISLDLWYVRSRTAVFY